MKKVAILFFACFMCAGTSYALDWIPLHEEADKLTVAQAQESLKKNPGSLPDTYVLGLVYLNMRNDKEAGDVFAKMLVKDPGSIEAGWGAAEVMRRRHDLIGAQNKLEEIIKKAPGFSPAYISLAYIKYIKLDLEGSLRLALKVMQQKQKDIDSGNYVRVRALYAGVKGLIAHYGGPLSKVINGTVVLPTLKRLEAVQPDSPVVLFGLGSFYFLAPPLAGGDNVLAEGYLLKAAKADPLLADIYSRIAQYYQDRKNDEKYRLYINKALELDPQNELALDIKAGGCKYACPGK